MKHRSMEYWPPTNSITRLVTNCTGGAAAGPAMWLPQMFRLPDPHTRTALVRIIRVMVVIRVMVAGALTPGLGCSRSFRIAASPTAPSGIASGVHTQPTTTLRNTITTEAEEVRPRLKGGV